MADDFVRMEEDDEGDSRDYVRDVGMGVAVVACENSQEVAGRDFAADLVECYHRHHHHRCCCCW